ncbi:ubiquitin thioesterase OTU1, partial [Haematococcus lacustris]
MTVQAFLALISEKTGIAASEQEVMAGYPPRQLQLPTDVSGAALSSLPLANGDTITLRAKATAPATAAELGTAPASVVSSSRPSLPPPPPYPATGQVGYVMEGSRHAAPRLRKVIADTVRADPVTYNEAWILGKDKWGGAIELSILAAHFGREIAAYDIQTKRCDLYGQDAGYSERVMLLYDGLHYDSLAVAAFEGAPEELDTRILDLSSPRQLAMVEEGATKLVAACHDARMFTNTASFTLRCGVCQVGLKGEREAVDHAKFTGHQNFTEY